MGYTIPVEFYEILEEKVSKELASKYDIELVRKEMEILKKELENKMDILEKNIENKISNIENRADKLDLEIQMLRKELRFVFLIIFLVIVAINQNSLEFIAKIFGLIK